MLKYLKKYIKIFIFRLNNRNSIVRNPENCALNSKLDRCRLEYNSRVAARADLRNVLIDNHSTVGRDTKIMHTNIGKFSSISWNVTINARNHELDCITTHAFPYASRLGFVDKNNLEYETVTIGNDVWVGAGVIILPGITIGDGAVVGAGSVVTKDIEPYSIVAGNPAKLLRKRFDDEEIAMLMKIKWWDFSDEKILSLLRLFKQKNDIKEILELLSDKYSS